MNIPSLTSNQRNFAAIIGGTIVFIVAVLLLSGGGSGGSSVARGASVKNNSDFDVDVCSFLTTEDIAAAIGIENMTGHDEGRSSATGARVCQFDTGNGMLPTLTVWARPNSGPELPDGTVNDPSYVAYARNSYKGVDLPEVGDDAFLAGGHVYVQKGDVTLEITTLVMKGYLPGKIEGDPLVELARRAAEKMPAAAAS
ncbi:MAG: hypothetical protein ACRDHF_08410 [Tepidiformaceae bacterium]